MLNRSKAASAFLAQDHRLDDRAPRRVIPFHQQHPHGLRMHLAGAAEEGNAAHPAQVLADDEKCRRHAADGQLAERRQPGVRRRFADDAEFPAEPARQVVPQRMRRPGIAVDDEQDRRRRRQPPSARWRSPHLIPLGSDG